ncbi:MAG TPA: patatin-like phospholipase family protein [Candidatus Krumholzibacteria bacterium]|nr:patatin-like phospholipase family protein [Candidatus Krumholzibacteria bacterium]
MAIKAGLVLGGGGARSYAHIGVLKSLEQRGIKVAAIAGCSMGGIIGALHAAGYSWQEIYDRFNGLDLMGLFDRSRMGGLIGSKGVTRHLEKHLPATFEELKIPLAVTAVDVQRGRLVVLNRGKLLPALRATSALPGIFAAVKHEGRVMIDGSLLNNLPVDIIRTMTLAPVIAVDTSAPADRELVFEDERTLWEKMRTPLLRGKRPLIFEMLMKSIDIPQAPLTSVRLSLNPPEVLIRPALDPDLKIEDYNRLEDAVKAGFEAAEGKLQVTDKLLRANQ